ncbi:MAG TPA: SRPBCC family protein, partial [Anaerolineales bacterium]
MNVIESSVVINQPVEDVFAYYTDLENETQWRIGVLELETTSEGPIGVGTTTREVTQFLGRRIENTAVVTEYEPNKVVAMETTSGPIPFKF